MDQKFMRPKDLAGMLDVGHDTVLRWIHEGTITFAKQLHTGKGARYLLARDDVDRWLSDKDIQSKV